MRTYTVTVKNEAFRISRAIKIDAPTAEIAAWIATHAFVQVFTAITGEPIEVSEYNITYLYQLPK